MERKELEAKIIGLVATAYDVEESTLTAETSIKDDLGGASIQMVGLVSEIENELDVLVQIGRASCRERVYVLV